MDAPLGTEENVRWGRSSMRGIPGVSQQGKKGAVGGMIPPNEKASVVVLRVAERV